MDPCLLKQAGRYREQKYFVAVRAVERQSLRDRISKGTSSAQAILKARILLKADEGRPGPDWTDVRTCEALATNMAMVGRVRKKRLTKGLAAVFKRTPRSRPARTPIFDGAAKARLIALAEIDAGINSYIFQ